jgi:hypothetical protein
MIAPFWTGLSVMWCLPWVATELSYIAFTSQSDEYAPYCPIKWEIV